MESVNGKLFYLATPYSHNESPVREKRFRDACEVSGFLLNNGIYVFSPIAHTHPIACQCDLPKGFDFWSAYDTAIISRCSGLIVVMMDGWRESKGVAAEIKLTEQLGLPIHYAEWPCYEIWFEKMKDTLGE